MDKALELKIVGNCGSYCLDFLKGELASEHHALCAEAIPSEACGGADSVRLGGYVNLHFGQYFFNEEEDADVGDNHSVDRNVGELCKIITESRILILAWHSVKRKIYLNASLVGVGYCTAKLVDCKIIRGGAHTEARACEVYRVCTIENGGAHFFKIACGR